MHALGVGEPRKSFDACTAGNVPTDVGPAREVGRGVPDVDHRHHAEARRRLPHAVPSWMARRDPARRAAVHGVEEVGARATGTGVLQLGDRDVEVGEVDDGDCVQPIRMRRQPLGEEVVAASHTQRAIGADELELLPIATRVHEAVVDSDAVHPLDALVCRRLVLRMENHRSAPLLRASDECREQLHRRRPALRRQPGEQITGDPECEHVDAVRKLLQPRCQRVLDRVVPDGLPMRVDVDDHGCSSSQGQTLAAFDPAVNERATRFTVEAHRPGLGNSTSSASSTPSPSSAAQRYATMASTSTSPSICPSSCRAR